MIDIKKNTDTTFFDSVYQACQKKQHIIGNEDGSKNEFEVILKYEMCSKVSIWSCIYQDRYG